MKKMIKYTAVVLILFTGLLTINKAIGQSQAEISNVDFYADDNVLIIVYDIIKAQQGEIFDIWIRITAEGGREVKAYSMTGDVGSNISGGENKSIRWNMAADNANIESEISVEVYAKSRSGYVAPPPDKTKDKVKEETKVKKEKPKDQKPAPVTGNVRKVSTGKAMVFSLLLPGLGNRYVKGKGAQWLVGVAAYGFIGGGIAMNNKAYNNLESYKTETDPEARTKLYDDAKKYDNISKGLLGSAAVIWVVDLVITGIQAGKASKKYKQSKAHLNFNYNPQLKTPLIGLSYNF